MRRVILPKVVIGVVFASIAVAQAETNYVSWQGEWRINATGTKYPAGFPEITDHVIKVAKDDGKTLEYTDSSSVGGKPLSSSFDGTYGGKEYPTSDGHMMWYKHVSADTFEDRWTDKNGTVGQDRCTFTPDRKHMTCHGSVVPPNGKEASYDERWDKVQ
jgi:hypothetical protein